MKRFQTLACVLAALLAGCAANPSGAAGLGEVDNVVVIYAENRSFDHLYGMFPGAEGIADAKAEEKTQLDRDGKPLPYLPPVYSHGKPDPRYPTRGMPNGPFRIDAPPIDGRLDAVLPSPWHLYYQNREQINGGKNNMFVALANVGAWVMGYFDGSRLKLWHWAREYTLADHFFMGAFGGSFLNHQWLICACTPYDPNASAKDRATVDAAGRPAAPLTAKTIGDTLSQKGVSWAWYAGG